MGGTCLHRGCIPAKQFLETASVFRTVAGAKEFGVQADQPTVDFATSQARKQKVVNQLWKGLQSLLKGRKVTVYKGRGWLRRGAPSASTTAPIWSDGPSCWPPARRRARSPASRSTASS